MLMAVVPRDQADQVMEALITAGYTATFTESRGGMLRQAQQMLFIAIRLKDLDQILAIIRDNCRKEVPLNGEDDEALTESSRAEFAPGLTRAQTTYIGNAVVFVWDLERFEMY